MFGKIRKFRSNIENLKLVKFSLMIALAALALAGAGTVQARPASVPTPYTGCANPEDQTDLPEAECLALVALYDSTAGASWTSKTGWKATNTPCNDWYGVVCSGVNVTSLVLTSNNLVGSLPTELENLSSLQILNLNFNSIGGTIPASLGNLTNLINLQLANNSLTGVIPTELGNLSNINYFRVENNSLTGTIPSELANLTNLTTLWLSGNDLSGSVPAWLGNLTSLNGLSLSDNLLTGAIPPELGNLSNLGYLYLGNNDLSGSIPKELGNLSSITWLKLQNTQLTGQIPAALSNLTTLYHLDLSTTNLEGPIPQQLGNLTNLHQLLLYNNSFRGWLPSNFTNLASLSTFYFHGTSLCEPPDTAFQEWLTGVTSVVSTNVDCNILFSDGFESGDFSAWDAAKLGGGDLKVCAKAAINGAYGMCVKNMTNNTKFVADSGLSAAAHSAQFNFDPNGLNLQNLKIIRVFLAKSGATPAYWLQMRKINGKYQVRVIAKLDGGTNAATAWKRISNSPHLIEVEWEAASGPGIDDGYLKLYIDGRLWRKALNLDNDTFVVDAARLGFTNSPKKFTVSGIFFIDDYLSSDSGYIGP